MRYYFHLVSCHGEILEETGVEVTDLEAAEAEALRALQELHEEDPQANEDLQGWQLIITDRSGDILGYVQCPEGLRAAVVLGSLPGDQSGVSRPFLS